MTYEYERRGTANVFMLVAKRIVDRMEFVHTPKHGSLLNMAEIELSLLSQCLKPRVPDADTLRQEVAAWQAIRNAKQARIHCTFRLEDVRRKLTRLYPAPSA